MERGHVVNTLLSRPDAVFLPMGSACLLIYRFMIALQELLPRMEVVFLLIPISLLLVAVIIYFLFWAIRSGQFDDLEGEAYQILMDDDRDTIVDEDDP